MADTTAAVVVSFEDNGIAIVRMQRDKNRLNKEFLDAFNNCLDTIEKTPSCRGMVTTGEGKFFCNGVDLDWAKGIDYDALMDFNSHLSGFLQRLFTFPVPTVAALNGHCYGGGAMLAFHHDFRLMNSERGWLCFNEVFVYSHVRHIDSSKEFTLKHIKAQINPQLLHRAIVLGQRFTGPEAMSAGMVDKAVVASLVLHDSCRFLVSWINKYRYTREGLHSMRMSVYADAVKKNEMQCKL